MRWKRKPIPKKGDTRKIKRFHLWPKLYGEEWIWLEIVYIKQEY